MEVDRFCLREITEDNKTTRNSDYHLLRKAKMKKKELFKGFPLKEKEARFLQNTGYKV